jgi:hypothetical protein
MLPPPLPIQPAERPVVVVDVSEYPTLLAELKIANPGFEESVHLPWTRFIELPL